MCCTDIKWKFYLLDFYSGSLRALLLALSEGVWSITCHYNGRTDNDLKWEKIPRVT